MNSDITLRISHRAGVVIERYSYSRGWTEPLERHAHDSWQIGWSPDADGEHSCRGATHRTARCEFSLIGPGQVHAPSQDPWVPAPCQFAMLYVDPTLMHSALRAHNPAVLNSAYRGIAVIADRSLTASFRRFLHHERRGSCLAADVSLQTFLERCVRHIVRQPIRIAAHHEHRAVTVALEVLHSRVADDVSLTDLSAAAGLSPHRLCRSFSAQIGMPPHAYQLRLRIDRAKSLLLRDRQPLSEIATCLGFADQSHFGRCFKRVVGTSPGEYRRGLSA